MNKDNNETDQPVKDNDDAVDSLRYFVTMLNNKNRLTLDDIIL
jgi:hypothetical protein